MLRSRNSQPFIPVIQGSLSFPYLTPSQKPIRRMCIYLCVFLIIASGCEQHTPNVPEGFEINPQFQLELVASEPLVFDPVDMEFDEKGRAFVLEMPGYPLRDEESRLILLKDVNGDGVYDERKVFADNLLLASSFLPYNGGMLVAAPPKLLFIKDTDGDEVADEFATLMNGYSAGNLQHNFNGLTFGLDNWIYAANGGNSGSPYFVDDSILSLDMRGDDFRFRLGPNQLERVGESSGGFELAFDQWGRMYETHNLEHVSQLVFEGKYQNGLSTSPSHALTVISDHEENGLSRIYPIGEQETRVNHPEQSGYFSGSCGITFYGGNAFPEGFNNNLFVADVVLNLIHLDVLSPNGSAMKTSRMREKVEFLASTDRSFRPVNLTTGPDGALYLLDMHREAIEHPEWIPDEMEVNMDLEAGKDMGRIYKITPTNNWRPHDLQAISEKLDERIQTLAHPNQWARTTAQRLLIEEADENAQHSLETFLSENEHPLGRLHAMWTLEGLGKLSNDLLKKCLDDESAGVRENALKIAENRMGDESEILEIILSKVEDDNARVRLQATLALSMLDQTSQQPYADGIQSAMMELLNRPETDIWMSMAIAGAVKNQAAAFCGQLLSRHNSLSPSALQTALTLSRFMGQENKGDEIANLVRSWQDISPDQIQMLEAMAQGWERGNATNNQPLTPLVQSISALEAKGDLGTIRATAKLREAMGVGPSSQISALMADARDVLSDPEQETQKKVEGLQLLALDKFENKEKVLFSLLDNRTPLILQTGALQQIWQADRPEVGEKLLNLWSGLGPEARKLAGNILLYKSYHHDLLLSALESGQINAGELNLDLERRRVLLFSENDEVKHRAEALFSDAGVVQRKEAMAKMRPALTINGDAGKGKILFTSACSSCHQYGDIGKNVGPVLTEINRKSKESLLHDIIDPNAAVDTKYLNYQVRTKAGDIFTGMVFMESDTEVGLKMNGGEEVTLNKGDIEEFSSLGISLMPEGLEGGLEPEDLANLLAFLQGG